jgi:hypothetical protein
VTPNCHCLLPGITGPGSGALITAARTWRLGTPGSSGRVTLQRTCGVPQHLMTTTRRVVRECRRRTAQRCRRSIPPGRLGLYRGIIRPLTLPSPSRKPSVSSFEPCRHRPGSRPINALRPQLPASTISKVLDAVATTAPESVVTLASVNPTCLPSLTTVPMADREPPLGRSGRR